MKEHYPAKHYPVYRSRLTGKIWTTDSIAETASGAEARGIQAASEMDMHDFISVCTDFPSFLAGYKAGMDCKADQIQPRLADLELRISKAVEALGSSAI